MWRRWGDLLGWFVSLAAATVVTIGLAAAPAAPTDRVEAIAKSLRCPVCQTVSVAESPSETARAMREIIAQQVAAGRSDQEIVGFFVDRYGRWIILAPPPTGANWTLWLLPPAALAAGVVVGLRRKRRVRFRYRAGAQGHSPTQASSALAPTPRHEKSAGGRRNVRHLW